MLFEMHLSANAWQEAEQAVRFAAGSSEERECAGWKADQPTRFRVDETSMLR